MRERALSNILLSLTCIFLAILGSAAETSAFSVAPAFRPSTLPRRDTTTGIISPVTNLQILRAAHDVEEKQDQEKVATVDVDDRTESKFKRGRQLVPAIAAVTLVSTALAAKLGVLPGPLLVDSGGYGTYTDAMIARDVGSAVLTGTLGYVFVKLNTWLAEKGYLDPRDSRKIIHTCSAPLFILFWPLFSPAVGARFFAASVSFVNVVRLYIAGSGGDESLAYAVSRSGSQGEALGGPFLYVVILMFSILLFWQDGPTGIIALSAMAAGDGLADLVGRRYGAGNKWWFNKDKSIAGSLAFWVGGTACALALLKTLSIPLTPTFPGVPSELLVSGIILTTALLEVVPADLDDNWIVPLSAAVLAAIAFS